ncbi:MAG TPA: hypothetical protein VFZ65_18280 [Planctomycetota bacterium]|nr:hypothetical protein [Planctomycetota bacterium]
MKLATLLLVLALLLQMGMLDGFAWLSEAAYGPVRQIGEEREGPLTMLGLLLAGPCALGLVAAAIYLFLARAPKLAALLCVGLCLPSLAVATLVTHVLVCVAGWW